MKHFELIFAILDLLFAILSLLALGMGITLFYWVIQALIKFAS